MGETGPAPIKLRCPRCGRRGTVIFDPSSPRQILSLSTEFYERVMKRDTTQSEIVCDRCGTVTPAR